jgi:hypothetical protein
MRTSSDPDAILDAAAAVTALLRNDDEWAELAIEQCDDPRAVAWELARWMAFAISCLDAPTQVKAIAAFRGRAGDPGGACDYDPGLCGGP